MSRQHRLRTLYHRVYLHGLALLLMVTIALGVAGVLFGRNVGWQWHPGRLAQHLGELLAPLDDRGIAAVAPRAAEELDVDLAIYDDGGHALVAGGPRVPPPLDASQVARLHQGHATLLPGHRDAAYPAGPGRYLRVSVRRTEGEALLHLLGGLLLVVAVVALVSAPLARAIVRPLEQLAGVARRLGEGDLSARSGLQRGDEIGSLARTFDEMAERLGRLLEGQRDLLANVSHELRTPLARIRVALSLAAEAGPDQARRHLGEIEQDVVELETLVADVLTATRLDGGGRLVLRREAVDLGALVEQALVRFRRHHPERSVEARLASAPVVEAEPGLLARVLDNLLDNAAKYSDPATAVVVELEGRDAGAAISVRDRGIGIGPEDQARVFTPFFRVDPSRGRDSGGAGLGLALSKRIVEAHGGRIALESAPGAGTVVTFWLPETAGGKA